MTAFPTVHGLAAAQLDQVLGLWSGLGYYARARNLHRAARLIAEEHGGVFPTTVEGLMSLPGVGRSTAGAIMALAYGKRAAILDGNVKRGAGPLRSGGGLARPRAAVQKTLWAYAETYTPHERVAKYTQAIMDLGATVCTRTRPRCGECPLTEDCKARIRGQQAVLPTPRPGKVRPQRDVRMLLISSADREVLLERRPPNGIWGGLYSLPGTGGRRGSAGMVPPISGRRRPRAHGGNPTETWLQPFRPSSFTRWRFQLDTMANTLMDRDGWLWYNPAQEALVGVAAPIAVLLKGRNQLKDRNQSREALT